MNYCIRQINQRMSLRKPQLEALERIAKVADLFSYDESLETILQKLKNLFPQIEDFEHEFPSTCCSLATGVGKTRLMGAIISYLFLEKGIKNYFILAPNNTILEKLIREFSNPADPKYVFRGICEFVKSPPTIITAENFDHGLGIRNRWAHQADLFSTDEIHINIFNIAMLHSERGNDRSSRLHKPRETIENCLSYFQYLSQQEDLVLLMDEAHRYRANASLKAINELDPLFGIEFTATPQIEQNGKKKLFKNILYNYPLSEALKDGFVKEPWVAGRPNFNKDLYALETIEKIKIADGIRLHENTKLLLQNYAKESGSYPIKPFILIITENTAHANEVEKIIKSDEFFEGRYKNRLRVVHSSLKTEEEERMIKDLIEVESFDNPIEIVIHVNMLKEGWDVKNLYTIIPLRAANSKTLIEQSIGRGLRLPFGTRTGINELDRLTIVSHDNFREIVDEANNPNSIIKSGILIGKDIPDHEMENIEIISRSYQSLDECNDSSLKENGEKILQYWSEQGIKTPQETSDYFFQKLDGKISKSELLPLAEHVHRIHSNNSIAIPQIYVSLETTREAKFRHFVLDLKHVYPQPTEDSLLLQSLTTNKRETRFIDFSFDFEESPEHFIAKSIIDLDFNDLAVNEDNITLLLNLAEQLTSHLRSYLSSDNEIKKVVFQHKDSLTKLIYTQMQQHYAPPEIRYSHEVSKYLTFLKPANYTVARNQKPLSFFQEPQEKSQIKNFLFTGFKKSVYSSIKFDSDSERVFSIVLENDPSVIKWVKPPANSFKIYPHKDRAYEPDFVVETIDEMLLCEVKRRDDIESPEVINKANAAHYWCEVATQCTNSGNEVKPWSYLLIPHDSFDITSTIDWLKDNYTYRALDASRSISYGI